MDTEIYTVIAERKQGKQAIWSISNQCLIFPLHLLKWFNALMAVFITEKIVFETLSKNTSSFVN